MRICLLALALLLLAASSAAFSNYASLLTEPRTDDFRLFMSLPNCEQFTLQPFPEIPTSLAGAGFESARVEALESKQYYEKAQAQAKLVFFTRLLSATPLFLADRVYRVICFKNAVESLTHAVRADQQALLVLDKRVQQFEHAAGEEPHWLAQGFHREVAESYSHIEAGVTNASSFGGQWLQRVREVNEASAAMELWSPGPSDILIRGLRAALSVNASALSLALNFEARAQAALGNLTASWHYALSSRDSAERAARASLSEINKEELEGVDESAFLLVGAGSRVATEHNLTSFSREAADATVQLAESDARLREAEREWKSDEIGDYSRALSRIEEALVLANEASARTGRACESSRKLESDLQQAARQKASELESALRATLSGNPRASAAAEATLASFKHDAEKVYLPTRGARIRFYARAITDLEQARGWLTEASRMASDLQLKLDSEVTELEDLLERASKDELEVEEWKRKVQSIKYSLGSLSSVPESSRQLALTGFQEELETVRTALLAEAETRYAGLENLWYKLLSLRTVLQADERELFEGLSPVFDGGLRFERALGSLRSTQKVLLRLWTGVETRKPLLLKRHLEEGAHVEWTLPPAGLGETVEGRISVELWNRLPLEYSGTLDLEPAGLENVDAEVLSSSYNLSFTNGRLSLAGINSNEQVRVELAWRGVLAEKRSTQTEQVGEATVEEARLRTQVRFSSLRPGLVKVVHEVPYYALLTASSTRPLSAYSSRSAGSSRIEATVDAAKGEGEVVFEESIDSPFRTRVSAEGGVDNNSLVLRLFLEGSVADLEKVSHTRVERVSCPSGKVEAKSPAGGSAEASLLGDLLTVRMRAPRLARGSSLEFTVFLECSRMAQLAEEKLQEAESLLEQVHATAEGADTEKAEEKLEQARVLLESGSPSKALPLIYDSSQLLNTALENWNKLSLEQAAVEERARQAGDALEELRELEVLPAAQLPLGKARESLAQARAELAEKQLTAAGVSLNSAESSLSSVSAALGKELDNLSKSCPFEECSEAREAVKEAQLHLASRAWSAFLESYDKAEGLVQEAQAERSKQNAQIKELLELVPGVREEFQSASTAFEQAFQIVEGQEKDQRSSQAYARGSKAQKEGTSELRELENAWEKWQQRGDGGLEAQTVELLQTRKEKVGQAVVELREAVESVQEQAKLELEQAKSRAPNSQEVTGAEEALGEGRAFTAWLLARSAQAPETPSGPVSTGEGLGWAVGAGAAAILITLAWVFSRGPPRKELREVE